MDLRINIYRITWARYVFVVVVVVVVVVIVVFKIIDFFYCSSSSSFAFSFLLQTPITSAVRGRHPEIIKFLLLEVDDSMKADHALTEVRCS